MVYASYVRESKAAVPLYPVPSGGRHGSCPARSFAWVTGGEAAREATFTSPSPSAAGAPSSYCMILRVVHGGRLAEGKRTVPSLCGTASTHLDGGCVRTSSVGAYVTTTLTAPGDCRQSQTRHRAAGGLRDTRGGRRHCPAVATALHWDYYTRIPARRAVLQVVKTLYLSSAE